MKILVISQYFEPENFRINDVCYELARNGHEVSVVTGIPNYPEGEIYHGYESQDKHYELINGVNVYRSNIRPRKKGAKSLFLNYISFMRKGTKKALSLGLFDIVYVYEVSPITQIVPGIKYATKRKVPLVVNCLDLWPESIKVMGIKETSLLFKLVKKYSAHIYKKVTTLLVPSPGFKPYLNQLCNLKEEEIQVLYNHAESIYLNCEQTHIDEKIHLLFAGNIGKAQNIDLIINGLVSLKPEIQSQLIIDIVGDGSYLETLKEKVEILDLGNKVIFHGRKTLDEIQYYYNLADACILTLENSNAISKTIPAKVQGYMASGKPIIAAVEGSTFDLLEKAQCALLAKGNDISVFATHIENFVKDQSHYSNLGKKGRQYFLEHFTLNQHVKQLSRYLEDTAFKRK